MRISDWSSDVCSSDLGSISAIAFEVCIVPPRPPVLVHDDARLLILPMRRPPIARRLRLLHAQPGRQLLQIDQLLELGHTPANLAAEIVFVHVSLSLSWARDRKSTRLNSSH